MAAVNSFEQEHAAVPPGPLSFDGTQIADRVSIVYADAPLEFEENFNVLSTYADELRDAAFEALDKEAVLVVTMNVYHAVPSTVS